MKFKIARIRIVVERFPVLDVTCFTYASTFQELFRSQLLFSMLI